MKLRGLIRRYGLAVAAVLLCLALRLLLEPLLGHIAPFILFLPGVLVASWYAGFGPGVLASVLSVICTEFLFMQWRSMQGWRYETMRVALDLGVGLLLSYWESANLHARRELERTHQQVNAILGSITDAFCTLDSESR